MGNKILKYSTLRALFISHQNTCSILNHCWVNHRRPQGGKSGLPFPSVDFCAMFFFQKALFVNSWIHKVTWPPCKTGRKAKIIQSSQNYDHVYINRYSWASSNKLAIWAKLTSTLSLKNFKLLSIVLFDAIRKLSLRKICKPDTVSRQKKECTRGLFLKQILSHFYTLLHCCETKGKSC